MSHSTDVGYISEGDFMKRFLFIWAVLLVFGFGLVAYHMDPPPTQQQAQSSDGCDPDAWVGHFRVCRKSAAGQSEYLVCTLTVTYQHPNYTAEQVETACAGASKEWVR